MGDGPVAPPVTSAARPVQVPGRAALRLAGLLSPQQVRLGPHLIFDAKHRVGVRVDDRTGIHDVSR
jgi:hypothetical protein